MTLVPRVCCRRFGSTSIGLFNSRFLPIRMIHSNGPQPVMSSETAAANSETPQREQQHSLYRSLALRASEDDAEIRHRYRPFILPEDCADDWVNQLELERVLDMAENNIKLTNARLKVLVLYGSLRKRCALLCHAGQQAFCLTNVADLSHDLLPTKRVVFSSD